MKTKAMKTSKTKRVLSMLMALMMIALSVPFAAFEVAADESITITRFGDLGFLGTGFNLLAEKRLENENLASSVFITVEDKENEEYMNKRIPAYFDARYINIDKDAQSFTYISDASKFLLKMSVTDSMSIGTKAQAYMVTAQVKNKFSLEVTGSYEQENKTEYAVMTIMRKHKKKSINTAGTRILEWWGTDEYEPILSDAFMHDVENIASLGATMEEAYAKFFETYGTHIFTQYVSGGEASLILSGEGISKKVSAGLTASSDTTVEAGVEKFATVSTEFGIKTSVEGEVTSSIEGVTITADTMGGAGIDMASILRMTKGEQSDIDKWIGGINDSNSAILFDDSISGADTLQMMPIWSLLVKPEHQALRM